MTVGEGKQQNLEVAVLVVGMKDEEHVRGQEQGMKGLSKGLGMTGQW